MADTKDFSVDINEGKDWRELGVCRCCLSRGVFQSMDMFYWWLGIQVNYTEMLQNTFQITLVPLEKEGVVSSRLICDACVLRLRDADAFRRQVHNTELTMVNQIDRVQTEPKKDSILDEVQRVENFVHVKIEHQEDSDLEEQPIAVSLVSVKMESHEDSDLEEKQTERNFLNGFSSPESDEEALNSVEIKAEKPVKKEEDDKIKHTEDLVPPFTLPGTHRKMNDSEPTQTRRAAVAAYMREYRARKKTLQDIKTKSTEPFERIQHRRENAAERQRRHRARKRAAIRATINQMPPNGTEAFPSYATETRNGKNTGTTVKTAKATKSAESLERIQRRREVAAERQRRHRARKRAAIYTTATAPADWPGLRDNDEYTHLI